MLIREARLVAGLVGVILLARSCSATAVRFPLKSIAVRGRTLPFAKRQACDLSTYRISSRYHIYLTVRFNNQLLAPTQAQRETTLALQTLLFVKVSR